MVALEKHGWRHWWARPAQLAPDWQWRVWLILTGRGWGKTRTGAEYIREEVEAGRARRIALIGATAADVRDVMVEGTSGILAVSSPDCYPTYEPSKRRVTWPNGAVATTYSADKPDRLRGPQHDLGWADELAAWRYQDAWHMFQLGLRAGDNPRAIVTTTPKPVKLVRDLMAAPTTALTRGSTMENEDNLADEFIEEIISQYEGRQIYQQEIEGQYLDQFPDAMWTRDMIERGRITAANRPDLKRIVIAIDPAVTSGDDSDETGIIVAGRGVDGHGYVLADLTCRQTPAGWARIAIEAYENFDADRIIGEVNNGGDMVEHTLRTVDPKIPYTAVRASRGKAVRAEPAAALYEQGKVHHVGSFDRLEDQLVAFTADAYKGADSPDRADAMVYAITELLIAKAKRSGQSGPKPGMFSGLRKQSYAEGRDGRSEPRRTSVRSQSARLRGVNIVRNR